MRDGFSQSKHGLSSKQRAHLRREAHALSPLVTVGHGGVTDAVVGSVEEAFNTRELIKLKALESAPSPIREIAQQIAGGVPGSHVVHTIGRTAVLYRAAPEDDPDG